MANDEDERMSVISDFSDTGSDSTEHAPDTDDNRLPSQVPFKRPPNPNPNAAANAQAGSVSLNQPTRTSKVGTPHPDRDTQYPSNLHQLVDNASPYGANKPNSQFVNIKLEKYDQVGRDEEFKNWAGGNQGGLHPRESALHTSLPDTADYRERRPEQLLSQMSSVMKWSAEQHGEKPTEVQFGYVHATDGQVRLYSSTNDPKSQQWLKGALEDPLPHVKAAAKQSENPDVQRNALKLLFFKENQDHRKSENDQLNGSDDKKHKKIADDLDLSDKIHSQMFTGTHRVVQNGDPFKKGSGGLYTSDKYGNPEFKKAVEGRHAEQNVSEAMHMDIRNDQGTAEASGTKPRCYSCSSAIGPQLKDQNEQVFIAGKGYLAQSDKKSQLELKDGKGAKYENGSITPGTPKEDGRGRTHVATDGPKVKEEIIRSRSESPARLPGTTSIIEPSRTQNAEAGPSSRTKRTREDEGADNTSSKKPKPAVK